MCVGGVWDHMLHRRVPWVRQMARHSGETMFRYSKNCPWPEEHLLAGNTVLLNRSCPEDDTPDPVPLEQVFEAYLLDSKDHTVHIKFHNGSFGCRRKLIEQLFVYAESIKGIPKTQRYPACFNKRYSRA